MRLIVRPDYEAVSAWAAERVASRIRRGGREGRPFVLGLPTGSTPLGLYGRLKALCASGGLSLAEVVTFNMDEYVGLPAGHPQSYRSFMWKELFSGVDIKKENVHILDGNAPDPELECAAFEAAIAAAGGIDLFVGGVGPNGHLAFNEPGASPASRTRMIRLTPETRSANARFFGGESSAVPEAALTVGIGTVLDSGELLVIASGAAKARAVRHAAEGVPDPIWPVSAIQAHPNCSLVCDEAAVAELGANTLRRFREPEDRGGE